MITIREFKKEDVEKLTKLFTFPDLHEQREKAYSFTLETDDFIIGCGGIDRVYNHMGTAWLYINKDVCKQKMYLSAAIRVIRNSLKEYTEYFTEVTRLDAACQESKEYVKFAQTVGFKKEAILGNMGEDGENIVIMRYK